MKNRIVVLLAIVVLSACSTPKYTYYFDHHYNKRAGKQIVENVFALDQQTLQASAMRQPAVEKRELGLTYSEETKSERKPVYRQLKRHGKAHATPQGKQSSVESSKATQSMDQELKVAIVFGAVGVTGILIGSGVFLVIGTIALLIGLFFFVKWIIRQ